MLKIKLCFILTCRFADPNGPREKVNFVYFFGGQGASNNGHISVLDWFKNSGFEFRYSDNAIDWASENGHVRVLHWFKKSGFEFKYSNWAIDWASKNRHVEVLNWFKITNNI